VKNIRRLTLIVLLVTIMMASAFLVSPVSIASTHSAGSTDSSGDVRTVDIGNGDFIKVGPNEQLHKYVLTDQGWAEWTGYSDALIGAEYGNSTNIFTDRQMKYLPGSGTTTTQASVSFGTGWEAYEASAQVSSLTENRTWITNPGFQGSAANWSVQNTNVGGSSTPTSSWIANGHSAGDDCIQVDIDSGSASAPYYYDDGDISAYQQTTTVSRGTVVWSALRLDYWAETVDDTHYGMTGSFRLFANIEGSSVWRIVFGDIGAEETWYNTGLINVNPSIFNLPGDTSITTLIGLESLAAVGYDPNIHPRGRFDNVELYLKTLTNPSEINLEMNGLSVSDGASRGSCSITQIPASPWTTSPASLIFSWTPIPATPYPNKEIRIDFNVEVNMFARHYNIPSLYEIGPTAYGERFVVGNGTDVEFTSYFRANIPTGYVNFYFFNETIPAERDVYFVAQPLAPTTNITSGWNGGNPGDSFLNVSAYDITNDPGRYGYWRILSRAPNMISDLELWNPGTSSWSRTVNLRAGDTTRVRVNVGSAFSGSTVNVTVYKPDGSVWLTLQPVVDGTGYAISTSFTLDGSSAPAGNWMVQANTNNVGAGGDWTSAGLFKRPFAVTHASDITLTYPDDAVGTMITNITYGDLLLIILKVEDTDSYSPTVFVPGGTMTLDWVLGSDTFDDNGNGEYTKVIDTSMLSGAGQYIMNLDWTHPSFDPASTQLTINVNYAATLTSPDYPGVSGPVGDDQSFVVVFANVNGTGIDSGNLLCDWSNPYTVNPLGLGHFEFQLDMSGRPIGEYPIHVYATGSFIEPQEMLMYVTAREIYNSITYTSNQLSIPLGESASFILTWRDTDHGTLITGSGASITCNWTSFHSAGDTNYTVVESSPGKYNITVFTKSTDSLTGSNFIDVHFNVMKHNYQNHTFDIDVEIRKRNTLFVLDEPIVQTPYGSTITVLVFYQDTDLRIGIGNATEEVKLTITTPEVSNLAYTVSPSSLGLGHYNISIPSDQWGSIGWKNLHLLIEWVGTVDKFYSQTIDTSARITGTDTDLYLELAPTATYYLDSFNFSVIYWDTVSLTRISNATSNVFLRITALGAGNSVTQSDFVVMESLFVPGTYIFTLNSSLFDSTDSFRFELDFMWRKGQSPLYENGTMVVTLVVLDRPTYIDYTPVAATPYGEQAQLMFSFVDTLTSTKIADSMQLYVTLNDVSVSYSYSYDLGTKEFTLYIDTDTIGGIGTHVLHLNLTWVGVPFYAAVSSRTFSVTVVTRATQLSHQSFSPGQWGNNITIVFVYTDIVAGSTTGMTGTLTLNIPASKYTVVYSPEGHFVITLNTTAFASDGIYPITATVIHTNPNYASAMETLDVSVLKRSTQMGYDSPDPAPYLANVSLYITYVDDSTGRGIAGANIAVSGNGTSSLVLNDNYWITYTGNGRYLIEVNTTALGEPGVYRLSVSVTYSGEPFYLPQSRNIIARVTYRTTQILLTQTPGDVPFLENVVFKFKFTDYLLGTRISISQSDITLTHGPSPHTPIDPVDYTLNEYATYYEIIFNSTLLSSSSLVSGYSIQMTIDLGSGAPYYAPRNTTTKVSTVERPTQILFPLVQDTPYYDNISIELTYVDYLTGSGIDDAVLIITSSNTSLVYTLIREADGVYRILINSSIFGDTGIVYFDITLSKAGSPFYSSRTTLGVPATIRDIQTSIIAEAPPVGSTAVGAPIYVLIALTDFDHTLPISGALITSDWTALYGLSYTASELGNGQYTLNLTTTGLLAQKYEFHVYATKAFYQTAVATVSVQPGAATVEIYLERSTYYADWGELVNITFQVREPYYNTPVTGMTATLLWNGMLYGFIEMPGATGYYTLMLDSSDSNFGIYYPKITVTKQYYQQRQRIFSLIVSKATGQIIAEPSIYEVVINTSVDVRVALNDTVSGQPVATATVTMEFNGTVYPMTHIGSGIYSGNLGVSGFVMGQYPLTIRAVSINHVFLERDIDIDVVPIYTELKLTTEASVITVYFGDVIHILTIYNDTYYDAPISGANITYTLGSLTGNLIEETNHTYSALIDVSSLASQSIYLRLMANKPGYAMALKSIIVTILPIPTTASVDESTVLQSGFYSDTLSYIFHYDDLQHVVGIGGANVLASWGGSTPTVIDYANGTYRVNLVISVTTPGLYDLVVRFNLANYTTRTVTAKIEVYATPATILGPSSYSSPINDTVTIRYRLQNMLDNTTITDVIGTATSTQLGDIELVLQPSGNYTLNLPGDLPYGTYGFDVYFSTIKYTMSPLHVDVTVRQIRTSLLYGNLTIPTTPGSSFIFSFTYLDLDHNVPIAGATLSLTWDENAIIFYSDNIQDVNGFYTLSFYSRTGGTNFIDISIVKDGYYTQQARVRVQSDISAEQSFQQLLTVGGGFGVLIVVLLLVGYVRVWSVPKQIREINRMVRALAKGRIPKPASAPSRQGMAMVIVNEEIASLHLQKPREDIVPEPIVTTVPEVNELLEELATITGLGAAEIEAFRADLSRMRASERPGFLKEVIDQEKARRADVLAKPPKAAPPKDQIPLHELPGELEDLKKKLLKKGMASEEIDIIIEEAKNLSKADLEALLDSLGISLE
jgi:hypothetical protein